MSAKKRAKFVTKDLDPAMRVRILNAIAATWNAVAPDLLAEVGKMKKAEAVEAVLDADDVEIHGGDPEAAATLRRLSDKGQQKLARLVVR